ncbi:unnamed protein product [Orchesella dallaii]|uniref:non-specific serine/threonine protein kinase n=1 Tax=Orchesella dallaii TaxID=48710 RepID=A0ABP1QLZ8_9HEXA
MVKVNPNRTNKNQQLKLSPPCKDEVCLSSTEKMGLLVGKGSSRPHPSDDPTCPTSAIEISLAHSTTGSSAVPSPSISNNLNSGGGGVKAFSEHDVSNSAKKGLKSRIRLPRRSIVAPKGRPTSSGLAFTTAPQNPREFIRPRLVTIIRHGPKPRKTVRFLLNKKTAVSYDQVLNDVTSSLKPDWGAVRHVYTVSGRVVATLEDFFGEDDIFLACPNGRVLTPQDFELDIEECRAIQPYAKATLFANKKQKTFRAVSAKSKAAGILSPPNAGPAAAEGSHFPPTILEKFEVGSVIGDGSFAVVRQCRHRETGILHALKVLDKAKYDGKTDVPPEQEMFILSLLNHTNIIKLFERFELGNELYLVLELVPGGDLFDNLSEVTKFPEEEAKLMTNDIAEAIHYLHSLSIVHRDIKPENLFVYTQNGTGQDNQQQRRHLKLGDFGLALHCTEPIYTVCGTPTYVAPEILAEAGYGLKVDIWALGVIVYVLLCGYPPFSSSTGDQEQLFSRILSASFEFLEEDWKGISEHAKDIICKMILLDPELRLSAKEVLEHQWFISVF